LLVAFALDASADSRADIDNTHPSSTAHLATNETFYVRISFTTEEPLSLWARPFRNGVEVTTAMSNPSLRHEGSGEALGWFALTEPGDVDEVRIRAGGGKPYREWELASMPVQLEWTRGGRARPLPEWVRELQAIETARMNEDAKRRANEPTSSGDVAIFSGFMLFMLALGIGGVIVPVWAARKWQGGWRIAALAPVAVLGFVILRIVIDTARDPTSHNLWPFEIIMFGAGALGAIAVLKLLRRITGADG
jgi:hypothetical protein